MHIEIIYSADRTTITCRPLKKKERLPPIRKIIIENGQHYIVPVGLFPENICIGAIPDGYKKVSADKYQIIFKNGNAPRAKRKRTAAKCI